MKPTLWSETTFEDVKELFIGAYQGASDRQKLSNQIRRTFQKPDESVAVFIPRFRQLLLLLDDELSEKEQVRQIIEKMRPEFQRDLTLYEPTSIPGLRRIAQKIEAAVNKERESKRRNETKQDNNWKQNRQYTQTWNSNRQQGTNNTSRRYEGTRRNDRFNNNRRPQQNYQNRERSNYQKPSTSNSNSNTQSWRKLYCTRCNRNNHNVEDCRAIKKRDGTPLDKQPEKKSVNAVTHGPPPEDLFWDNSWGEEADAKIKHTCNAIADEVSRSKLITAEVKCNGAPIKAVIDTGAVVSVVNEELALALKWPCRYSERKLIGADGTPLATPLEAKIELKIKIGDMEKTLTKVITLVRGLNEGMGCSSD